jgi:hypothetical protein
MDVGGIMNPIPRREVVRHLTVMRRVATGDSKRMLTRAIELLDAGSGCAYCWQIDKLGERVCSNCGIPYSSQEWHYAVNLGVCEIHRQEGDLTAPGAYQ